MSKHRKAVRRRQNRTFGDVTINDFANSAVCNSREKKSSKNVMVEIKQQLVVEKPWDEKEYDSDFDFVEEENADGTISYVMKSIKIDKSLKDAEVNEKPGRDYPLDLWFLISEYIKPEDIGRFSCICKTSYAVVKTSIFWLGLYRRYYTNVPELPQKLQPKFVQSLYGVRASVIRSLFYTYPLFTNRFKAIKTEEHPDVLVKRQCSLMWHRKNKTQWIYYFKLKEINNGITVKRNKNKIDIFEILEDVSVNSEEGCRVLQITCLNFIPVVPVLGMFLTSVGVTLSQGFRHNRVQLSFGSGVIAYPKPPSDSCVSILLDPVVSVKILDWWHPLYPHSNNLESLLSQQ